MKVILRVAVCATLLRAGVTLAAPAPSASLYTCQNTVRSATEAFLKKKVAAVGGCLKAVSVDIIKKSQPVSITTATLCAKLFRQLYDSRPNGHSLDGKKSAAIRKKCEPGMPMVTHNSNDITGDAGGNSPAPGIDTNNLSGFCGSSMGEVQDWINCIDYTHECAAHLAIATEYPRALPWLNLVKGAIMSLPAPPKDPNLNSDAVIGLQEVVDRIDGSPADSKPDISCGPLGGSLDGLRADLLCVGYNDETSCYTMTSDVHPTTLGGAPGALYDVALRFRGVIESKAYTGGTTNGFWNVNGTPAADDFNIYKLEISNPAQAFYLNAGVSGLDYCTGIDYVRTVQVATGATVTLSGLSVDDREVINRAQNGDPIFPPGVTVTGGQFVQMDVVSITYVP